MEILTSVRRLYIRFKSPVNEDVYGFGRAALLLLVEVWNHTVPVRERRRIRVNYVLTSTHSSAVLPFPSLPPKIKAILLCILYIQSLLLSLTWQV